MLGRIGLDDEELGVVWGNEGGPQPTSRSAIMSHVEVRDHALWVKHIDGNEPLKNKILSMLQGELIELIVNDWRGSWVKMDDGKDGRPAPGVKAVGDSRQKWHAMNDQCGTVASIKEA